MLYRDAGVDIEKADRALRGLKKGIKSTFNNNVLSSPGYFGAAYRIPEGYKNPVLVSSIDSVGTKVLVASRAGKYKGIGMDIVNHCVNDILTMGARPLYILDYFACGNLEEKMVREVIEGITSACRENECSLIGGETAEMPDVYSGNTFDLAAQITGIVEKDKIIDGTGIKEGQKVYGLKSSGFHTNGYSLLRKLLFDELQFNVDSHIPELDSTLGEILLQPHRSYYNELKNRLDSLSGLVHITGGGFIQNIPRIMPEGFSCHVDSRKWEVPAVFKFVAEKGDIPAEEMFEVFNMGIGMIAVADEFNTGMEIGEIRKGNKPLIMDGMKDAIR